MTRRAWKRVPPAAVLSCLLSGCLSHFTGTPTNDPPAREQVQTTNAPPRKQTEEPLSPYRRVSTQTGVKEPVGPPGTGGAEEAQQPPDRGQLPPPDDVLPMLPSPPPPLDLARHAETVAP